MSVFLKANKMNRYNQITGLWDSLTYILLNTKANSLSDLSLL